MAAAAAGLKWVDVLENQFDKSWVDLDLLFNAIDEEEDIQLSHLCRKHASSLASCFSQLVHKSTVIFQSNAKLEAQLLHLREEFVQFEKFQQKLLIDKNYLTQSLVTALAENHKLKHPGDDSGGGGNDSVGGGNDSGGGSNDSGSGSNDRVTPSSKDAHHTDESKNCHEINNHIQENLEVKTAVAGNEQESMRMQSMRLENEDLKMELLDMESELVGARLDNVYLDKELAGRIQQIQILTSGTPPDVKERLWTQIEAEMCLQRSKTIAQICKSKQELRCKRQDDEALLDESRAPVGAAHPNHNNTAHSSEDNHEDDLDHEGEHSYAKGKQVSVLKNPADDLGMAIIGGKEHNLPVIISEVFPNSAVYRSYKIQAGDVILSVNGQDFSSVTHDEAVTFLSSLRGQISFQLMASENVCEDDPSNLNFRFYRIFDPEHQITGQSKRPDQKLPTHPGKAVLHNRAKIDHDHMASSVSTKVDPNPLVMSPVHKKSNNIYNTNVSKKPQHQNGGENSQARDKKSGKEVKVEEHITVDMSKPVVELCVEDGSIAHL